MLLHYKSWGEITKSPLVILHGLLGSLGNWESLAKKWSNDFWVIGVDQRNHGKSLHADVINYQTMSDDLKELLDSLKIDKCNILGHSMGGKTAMYFTLENPTRVNKLIVADILPSPTQQSHQYIFDAMQSIPLYKITNRQQADEWLQSRIVSTSIRQFILKNLNRKHDGSYEWLVNLPAIINNYKELMLFPEVGAKQFFGPVLFIKGALSDYINSLQFADIVKPLFPEATLTTIEDAGHWLHAETPNEVFFKVQTFLDEEN